MIVVDAYLARLYFAFRNLGAGNSGTPVKAYHIPARVAWQQTQGTLPGPHPAPWIDQYEYGLRTVITVPCTVRHSPLTGGAQILGLQFAPTMAEWASIVIRTSSVACFSPRLTNKQGPCPWPPQVRDGKSLWLSGMPQCPGICLLDPLKR